ncbi:Hypothetical protein, putative [Bodo saltans]|uniref:Uncharacterized protein n=1 Tax=Bodo saltans TaxID=75058 RepID=A0A0S4IWZ0_BODSA|nr:Hypothetical protein, putative [Bodo saltans]|eukprot:CUF84871.1 Hypothetical protein, putative [Bodo saltans]
MIAALEDNVEKGGVEGPERVFALAALRLCRTTWAELTETLPTVAHADPLICPQQQFDNMVKMNMALRSQLKEANRVARSVYRIVLGPISSSARTQETVFSALEQGVRFLRREMFVLQHEQQDDETELEELSFSIRDFLQLADFKMSHAAKRIFEVETNAAGADGSGIDWEFRVQELTRDLQAQLARVTRQSETEKSQANEMARGLRGELISLRQEHGDALLGMQQECDKRIKEFKEAFQSDIRDLSDELARRLQDLQIAFVYKIGEQREIDAEGKSISIRSLQQCLTVERAKIEAKALEIAGDPNASLERQADRYAGDTAVFDDPEDVHQNWDGETHETLVRLLKGKRAELDMIQRSNNVQNRLKNMEWETNLREVMKQYEEEISRLREKMKHLEAEVEHAAKLVTVRMQETAEARTEAQRMQRQLQEDMHRQKLKYDSELSAVNQELVQVTQQFAKAAQNAVNQEKQIADMNSYKNELTDEVDEAHETIRDLKAKMLQMRARPPSNEIGVQTTGRQKSEDVDGNGKRIGAVIQQAMRGKGRIFSAGSSVASDLSGDEKPNETIDGGLAAPQGPTVAHSRRESLANQYTLQNHRSGVKKMRQFFGHNETPPGTPPLSPQPGGIIPAPLTMARAKRRINAVLDQYGNVVEELVEEGDDEGAPLEEEQSVAPAPSPQRRKSKFSAWYETKHKQKSDGAVKVSGLSSNSQVASPSTSHPQSPALNAMGMAPEWLAEGSPQSSDQFLKNDADNNRNLHREWISEKLDPEYLSKLFTADPVDARTIADDYMGPPEATGTEGPNVGGSGFVLLTTEDASIRLINEPNFYRLVCKLAVAVEYASAAPSQHTQSMNIKRIRAMLPNSAQLLNTSRVSPVVLLDIICISQFLRTFWLPRIERIRAHTHAADGQWHSKDAYNNLILVLQKLRDLGSPGSIVDVPIEDIQEYVTHSAANVSRSSARSPRPPPASRLGGARSGGATSPVTPAAKYMRVIQAVDIKPIMAPLVHIMGFMFASASLVADLPTLLPEGVLSKPGSPVQAISPTMPEDTTPAPLQLRSHATGEAREVMMIVSNVPTTSSRYTPRGPIAHLIDAQYVTSQTTILRKASEAAIKRRGLVSSATANGAGGASTSGGAMTPGHRQKHPDMMLEGTRSVKSAR